MPMISRTINCKDCGEEFETQVLTFGESKGEKEYFSDMCPTCAKLRDKAREVADAEKEAAKQAARLAYAREHYPELALAAGIPPRLHSADLTTMARDAGNAEAIETSEGILKSETGGIVYLTGEAGTGKTWIAAALCRERIINLKPARFVRSNDLLNIIRAGFKSNTEVTDPFKTLPFIVIDDLGAECFTEWSIGYWYDLIDYRYNYLLPTVITSNLPLKDLKTKVSARVVSRIAESSMGVKLTGKDRRTK